MIISQIGAILPFWTYNTMNNYLVKIADRTYEVTLTGKSGNELNFQIDGRSYQTSVEYVRSQTAQNSHVNPVQTTQISAVSSKLENALSAPMPGIVVSINCSVGQSVLKGQNMLVIEAMKMENNLVAPKDAVVSEICVEVGQEVNNHQILVKFE